MRRYAEGTTVRVEESQARSAACWPGMAPLLLEGGT